MKKKHEEYFNSAIPQTKIYLDDIEDILEILKENDINVEISDDDNIYDSIDELVVVKGKNPKKIKLHGRKEEKPFFEWINIELTRTGSTIYVNHSRNLLLPAHEIEKLLMTRKRKQIYSVVNTRFAKGQIKSNSLVALAFVLLSSGYEKFFYPGMAFAGFALIWAVVFIIAELNPDSNTEIELERRHNRGIYTRNKDKIIVGVLMALVGAGLTLLVTFISNKIKS